MTRRSQAWFKWSRSLARSSKRAAQSLRKRIPTEMLLRALVSGVVVALARLALELLLRRSSPEEWATIARPGGNWLLKAAVWAPTGGSRRSRPCDALNETCDEFEHVPQLRCGTGD